MSGTVLYSSAALATLAPAAFLAMRGEGRRDRLFWLVMAVALVGSLSWAVSQFAGRWHTGFSATLWVTIAASLALFSALAVATLHAWRLATLLLPYLFVLGTMATIWSQRPEHPLIAHVPTAWIGVHIVLAVVTYSLLTMASMAGLAVLLQERALKAKQPTALTRRLPSIADSERLEVRLLATSELVLGLGIVTGMATQYFATGRLLVLDHKTLFMFGAFAVIGALLIAHYKVGVRGRRAARVVLAAYLLVTLGYPGVKFVTDIVLT